ncbi:sulfur carrier protein ThiS [Pelosinus sp. IPA-1]|uniref:sulfur carrier protein ThiS n=1 Tax=Pelosinus sp. IPA-1 TaxID=3029569 RepID=UPI00243618E4|nr:sulfur carrier protein ThiS [Pelosinus sp. IPA-1]GMA97831.1 hypothetical protein PIPA1_06310 [Pelosinus sp. IPA-1]
MLNGNLEKIAEEINLSTFLLSKGLNLDTIIVEYQGNIVKKEEWATITLQDKDCLEVLKFVGGG